MENVSGYRCNLTLINNRADRKENNTVNANPYIQQLNQYKNVIHTFYNWNILMHTFHIWEVASYFIHNA